MKASIVEGHTFTIATRYSPRRILGRGAYGVVCSARDSKDDRKVAIKRIRPFTEIWDTKHALREILLLKLLGSHPNIISLLDLSFNNDKGEVYMVMEYMDSDLQKIIESGQSLSEMHIKCFAKQLLEGINAMHKMGVYHRDLKPANILITQDCEIRITDFGLARFMDADTLLGNNDHNPMTEYVVTRWYRGPELLIAPEKPYRDSIDLWSIGCILGELHKGKPLFPGKNYAHQVELIFQVTGYSCAADLGFEVSEVALGYLNRKCKYPGVCLQSIIPEASLEAIRLLEGLLTLNPSERLSAEQALGSEYLQDAEILYDYSKVTIQTPPKEFFAFDNRACPLKELQQIIINEVETYSTHSTKMESEILVEHTAKESLPTEPAVCSMAENASENRSRASTLTQGTVPNNSTSATLLEFQDFHEELGEVATHFNHNKDESNTVCERTTETIKYDIQRSICAVTVYIRPSLSPIKAKSFSGCIADANTQLKLGQGIGLLQSMHSAFNRIFCHNTALAAVKIKPLLSRQMSI